MTTETKIPEGCLPFDIWEVVGNKPAVTRGGEVVMSARTKDCTPLEITVAGGRTFLVQRNGRANYTDHESPDDVFLVKPAQEPRPAPKIQPTPPPDNFEVVIKWLQRKYGSSVQGAESHGAYHPAPEPPITATLWLDAKGERRITVTAPPSVSKAELARIQAWIALQLLVEGE